MGLTGAQQEEIETSFWVGIEKDTGQAIDSFFHDYLIMRRVETATSLGTTACTTSQGRRSQPRSWTRLDPLNVTGRSK